MDLKELVNKTYTEDEIFELLVFEVEENFQHYLGKHFHLNLQRISNALIRVTELIEFKTNDETCLQNRANVDNTTWIEVTDNCGHVDVALTRIDRSYQFAMMNQDKDTYFQSGKYCSFGGEAVDTTPLTEEEMREGFAELQGCLQAYKKSKGKIAV